MKYMSLDQRGHVQAEYVWIDAVGNCRCKTKVRDVFFPPLQQIRSYVLRRNAIMEHEFHMNECTILATR
jgi:hypothetical protein